MQYSTDLKSLVDQIRLAQPRGTVYMGMYRADAKFVVPKDAAYIYGFMGPYGREFTIIQTRYDEVDGINVPREIIYFCLALHESIETAAAYLHQIAAGVHSICQLSANAGSTIVRETLLTEFPFATWRRLSRKIPFDAVPEFPLGGRVLDKNHTMALASKVWGSPIRERLLLANSFYEEALRYWRIGASPLLCLYLWMAVEALTEAVLERELKRRNMTRAELMDDLKIPYDQHSQCKKCKAVHVEETVCPQCANRQPPTKNDRKYHLLARIRRDLIFRGDKDTYDAVRRTSNNIEHGSAKFADIWAVPFAVYERVAEYVRETIFDLIDLEAESRAVLEAPYSSVYVSPSPPIKLGYNSDLPPRAYEIPPRPPYDYYALDFRPKPVAVTFDDTKREFVVDYGDVNAGV